MINDNKRMIGVQQPPVSTDVRNFPSGIGAVSSSRTEFLSLSNRRRSSTLLIDVRSANCDLLDRFANANSSVCRPHFLDMSQYG